MKWYHESSWSIKKSTNYVSLKKDTFLQNNVFVVFVGHKKQKVKSELEVFFKPSHSWVT